MSPVEKKSSTQLQYPCYRKGNKSPQMGTFICKLNRKKMIRNKRLRSLARMYKKKRNGIRQSCKKIPNSSDQNYSKSSTIKIIE